MLTNPSGKMVICSLKLERVVDFGLFVLLKGTERVECISSFAVSYGSNELCG